MKHVIQSLINHMSFLVLVLSCTYRCLFKMSNQTRPDHLREKRWWKCFRLHRIAVGQMYIWISAGANLILLFALPITRAHGTMVFPKKPCCAFESEYVSKSYGAEDSEENLGYQGIGIALAHVCIVSSCLAIWIHAKYGKNCLQISTTCGSCCFIFKLVFLNNVILTWELGEFTAKILENNVWENIGSFIFTKGKT